MARTKYPIGEWIRVADTPIKMKKGFMIIYSYAPSEGGHSSNKLSRMYQVCGPAGSRVCDYWMLIPTIEEQTRSWEYNDPTF